MAEYLKRDVVLSNADIITVQTREYGNIDVVPVEYLADLPTADVVEVKHGYWIEVNHTGNSQKGRHIKYTTKKCSVCGYCNGRRKTKRCPECGAKMDGRK